MRTPFICGNWKMNLLGEEAVQLASRLAEFAEEHDGAVDVGIAPPAVYLADVLDEADDSALLVFGQNCGPAASGAFTGEVSAEMLADVGASGVIIGHSERRTLFGETDEGCRQKIELAQSFGLDVILCVGETLAQREAGETTSVVKTQLAGALEGFDAADGLVVAYEPVWAIGTGKTATPAQAQEVHAMIRGWWSERFGADEAEDLVIQYGGSVKPGNAAELLGMPDIDGALVGGASLKAESFIAIIEAAIS